MKQSKQSKPKASRKGSETCHEPVIDLPPFTVIIHDPELKRIIEERKMAEEEKVDEPEVQILLEEPILEACPVEEEKKEDEYIAVFSDCGHKVLNPQSKRWVRCDSALAKRLNLLRK